MGQGAERRTSGDDHNRLRGILMIPQPQISPNGGTCTDPVAYNPSTSKASVATKKSTTSGREAELQKQLQEAFDIGQELLEKSSLVLGWTN